MNDKPKSKLRWRLLRWGLIGLAVIATLAAILLTEENWRSKRAWENYQREAEARGERFDLASVVPLPVPDDQNFFCAPIVAEAVNCNRNRNTGMLEPRDTNVINRMDFNIYPGDPSWWPTNGGNWQKGKLSDLKQWQRYYRDYAGTPEGKTNQFPLAAQPQTPAADILLALSGFNPALEELRQALQRPYARLPLKYENGFEAAGELFPYLANMKRCAQFLQLRILAELENGQSEQALEDIKLLLGVTDSVRNQPFLITHLVRIAMLAITLQPVYEGLAQQRWSDAQLAELERALAKLDFFADYEFAMRGEKIFAIQTFENQRITREMKYVDDTSGTNKIITISLRWMPELYFYRNQLCFAQLNDQIASSLVDLTNRMVSPAALHRMQADIEARKKHALPYEVQALMAVPAVASAVRKCAMIQAQVDLARVACALERFHLAHGNYPETLGELSPQFIEKLPHDIINGQPLHYRRTDDGRFVLYSIGWDEKDDGGKIFLTKNGTVDRDKGDWVWAYPLK